MQRTVERVEAALIPSEQFKLPGQKVPEKEETVFEVIAVDVSETPCERPEKNNGRGTAGRKSVIL
ncbi:hypothetical protein [Deinococcus psychrotolerans]|uniref:hypothetical protein n=1 Tax=Deinococcus psychrotolerans TaxID=2489213 RepID=UPI001F15234D|nr:hypothetical protein [Deinococcus psychrotolerans]